MDCCPNTLVCLLNYLNYNPTKSIITSQKNEKKDDLEVDFLGQCGKRGVSKGTGHRNPLQKLIILKLI